MFYYLRIGIQNKGRDMLLVSDDTKIFILEIIKILLMIGFGISIILVLLNAK